MPFSRRSISLTLLAIASSYAAETTPYLTPSAGSPATVTVVKTAGETGAAGTKMGGIPDGLGAFDNNDGTFTVLMNHEFGNTVGVVRAHGSKGAWVSRWVINKTTWKIYNFNSSP